MNEANRIIIMALFLTVFWFANRNIHDMVCNCHITEWWLELFIIVLNLRHITVYIYISKSLKIWLSVLAQNYFKVLYHCISALRVLSEFCGINLFLTWQQFKNHSIVLFIFTRGRNTFNVFISLYVSTFKFLTIASIILKEEDREGGETIRILSGKHLQYRAWWHRGLKCMVGISHTEKLPSLYVFYPILVEVEKSSVLISSFTRYTTSFTRVMRHLTNGYAPVI